jgi:glycosyltransferase involved in cell wall biosynthesis
LTILYIIPEINLGGAELSLVALANETAKCHRVELISFKSKIDDRIRNSINANIIIKEFSKGQNTLAFLWKLMKYLREQSWDIIHGHLFPSLYPLVIASFLFPRKKILFTQHFERFSIKSSLLKWLYVKIIPYTNINFIALTEQSRLELQKFFKGSRRIFVIPNGIERQKKSHSFDLIQSEVNGYRRNRETKVFITLGRIVRVKNQQLMVNAFKLAYTENTNVILIIIGDSATSAGDKLKKQLMEMASPNTFFIGRKDNVADYLYASDFFAISSFSEGHSIAATEALACGLPIISTNYTNANMVVRHRHNGYIVKETEAEAYFRGIVDLTGLSPSQYQNFANNSYEVYRKNYTIERIVKKYYETINKII